MNTLFKTALTVSLCIISFATLHAQGTSFYNLYTPDFTFNIPSAMSTTITNKKLDSNRQYGLRHKAILQIQNENLKKVFESSASCDLIVDTISSTNLLSPEDVAKEMIKTDTADLMEPATHKSFTPPYQQWGGELIYCSRKGNDYVGPMYESTFIFYALKIEKFVYIRLRFMNYNLAPHQDHTNMNFMIETIFGSVEQRF